LIDSFYDTNKAILIREDIIDGEEKITLNGLLHLIRICGANCNGILQAIAEYKNSVDDFVKYINERHREKTLTLVKTAYYIEQTPKIVKDYPILERKEEIERQQKKKKNDASLSKRAARAIAGPLGYTGVLASDAATALQIPLTGLFGKAIELTGDLAGAYGGLATEASEFLMYKTIDINMQTTYLSISSRLANTLRSEHISDQIRFHIYAVVFQLYMCLWSYTRNFQIYEQISKKTTSKQYVQDRSTYQINLLVTSVNFNSCITQYNYLLDEEMDPIAISESVKKIKSFINVIKLQTKQKDFTYVNLKEILPTLSIEDYNIIYPKTGSILNQVAGKPYRKYTRHKLFKSKNKKNSTRRYNK
jgi:hypothetical protein